MVLLGVASIIDSSQSKPSPLTKRPDELVTSFSESVCCGFYQCFDDDDSFSIARMLNSEPTVPPAVAAGNVNTTDTPTFAIIPPPDSATTPQEKAKKVLSKVTENTQKAMEQTSKTLSSWIPSGLKAMTQAKYTLPDKTVASQVLMYRQLLHTKCRPGLRLSRPYQGTPAQKCVLHMPWWEQGIEDSGKMVISYDNLIVRLWMNGAIMPFAGDDLISGGDIDTMIDDKGLPPVPHNFWVERLGFQQTDPVTDFRSGGVLSLGLLVHMVESHPIIVTRFMGDGDAHMLPFGITSINITDMLAKFLMLAKSTDRMDALLSQKPFWRMFADPNAILACQELSMDMLCDVVAEMSLERTVNVEGTTSLPEEEAKEITVFDFPKILEVTERRVRDDLLGGGPGSVEDLRLLHAKLKIRYDAEAKKRRDPAKNMMQQVGTTVGSAGANLVERIKTTKVGFPSPLTVLGPPSSAFATLPNLESGSQVKTTGDFSIDDDDL